MHSTHSQDQSTQAMTEVALALSMAFFSLLVLALISVGVPEPATAYSHQQENIPINESEELGLQASMLSADSAKITQYVFYFNQEFYDQHLSLIDIQALNKQSKVVLAMPKDTDVNQALVLQNRLAEFDLVLTVMDNEWQDVFESLMF